MVFYYLGALILPIAMWLVFKWLIRKYELLGAVVKNGKELVWQSLSLKQKIIFIALFVMAFLFMELFWRMMFEFLIAYMQMRDALLQA